MYLIQKPQPKTGVPTAVYGIDQIPSFADLVKKLKKEGLERPDVWLFYDKILDKNPIYKKIIRTYGCSIGLSSGESLKDLKNISRVAEFVLNQKTQVNKKNTVFVSLGGGSLGDFVGFFSSIFKRGIPWIQIPTTSLSALDSAHGGKTACNVGLFKNQIGTFHFPLLVLIPWRVLAEEPAQLKKSFLGELAKMAFLDGNLARHLEILKASKSSNLEKEKSFVDSISLGIQAKYKWIYKDPWEKTGVRAALNLGHTLGHVLETQVPLPHGLAVGWGLKFALWVSFQKKAMTLKDFYRLWIFLGKMGFVGSFPKFQMKLALKQVLQDKKNHKSKIIRFVGLKGIGVPLIFELNPQEFKTLLSQFLRVSKDLG